MSRESGAIHGDGRYQILNVAWDSRPKSNGGQRWFHLFPDKPILIDSPLHWQGPFQRWNSRCAHCHSTGLTKNYHSETSKYTTQWAEVNVGCEACHGPGSAHKLWANSNNKDALVFPSYGLTRWLKSETEWTLNEGSSTANRHGHSNLEQLETCAGCHSRRELLAEADGSGERFEDHHRLRFLDENLYYADGQIRDEVFVYGSFLQSKMFQHGVVCSDCHQAHSSKLKADGNALCTRCHASREYDQPMHHQHSISSEGALCVNCHMPETLYMQVDPRRDHSIRIPRPDLTQKLGTPNACNQCHNDRSAAWAMDTLNKWLAKKNKQLPQHYGETLNAVREGQVDAWNKLQVLLETPLSGIVRATALLELPRYSEPANLKLLQQETNNPDPLIRRAALQALRSYPVEQGMAWALGRLKDPIRAVRLEAMRLLLAIPPKRIPAGDRELVNHVEAEYLKVLQLHADTPGGQLQLGSYHNVRGHYDVAEQHLRKALELNPQFVPAMFNLAELLRTQSRDDDAEPFLDKALQLSPEDASLHYALGLLYVRKKSYKEATGSLARAAELEPSELQYGYVYSVALEANGKISEAIVQLELLLERFPGDQRLLEALVSYYLKDGQHEKAYKHYQSLRHP